MELINSYDFGGDCGAKIHGDHDLGVIRHDMIIEPGFSYQYVRGSVGEDTHMVIETEETQIWILDPDSWQLHWSSCVAGDWVAVFFDEDDLEDDDIYDFLD
jgi:hypothetical protein